MPVLSGDCRDVLPTLPEHSVHLAVTSPPYFKLRAYGLTEWRGGDPGCDHSRTQKRVSESLGKSAMKRIPNYRRPIDAPTCPNCGAIRGKVEIGQEDTPQEFIQSLLDVFRGVRRALRPEGTLWVNIADTRDKERGTFFMIPELLCLAMIADGWLLRSKVIWHKPKMIPESVTNRPTQSYEHIFLFSQSREYFYDYVAVGEADQTGGMRNLRDVWTFSPSHFNAGRHAGLDDADHYAAYPLALPALCIKAGTSERGVCSSCGSPWQRKLERTAMINRPGPKAGKYGVRTTDGVSGTMVKPATVKTVGWEPTCSCGKVAVPATVLDPFSGTGTTGEAALKLKRRYIGIEQHKGSVEISKRRVALAG